MCYYRYPANGPRRVVGHESLANLQQGVTVDRARRGAARARIRVLVKPFCAQYDYPPVPQPYTARALKPP